MKTPTEQAIAAQSVQHLSMIDAAAVDLSSTDVTFTRQTRALFVGGTGTLKVIMASGRTVTLTGVLSGAWLPLGVLKVFKTGTSATNIVALF